MPMKSTQERYGRVAIGFHWVSALLILGMLSLGFLMQHAEEGDRLFWYRLHAMVGFAVLLLTIARIAWKLFDEKPEVTPGLTGIHLRGMELVHVLLYLILLVLVGSGIALNVQSGFLDVLRGATQDFPDFAEFGARRAHGTLARIYIALLVAHIGGVAVHQFRHGNAFARMGIGKSEAA